MLIPYYDAYVDVHEGFKITDLCYIDEDLIQEFRVLKEHKGGHVIRFKAPDEKYRTVWISHDTFEQLTNPAPDMFDLIWQVRSAMGNLGANADLNHPLRDLWERCTEVLEGQKK